MFSKLLVVLVLGLACQALHTPNVESSLLKSLQTKKSANILISISGGNTAAIRSQFKTRTFSSRAQKLNTFYSLLKENADQAQADVLSVLEKEKANGAIVVRQLWITNQIIVKNADFSLVEKLLGMDSVHGISEERLIPLEEPAQLTVNSEGQAPPEDEQWGVSAIRAPEVWAEGYRGAGAVVAIIDTGVRGTHEALKDGYRSDNGWFEPSGNSSSPRDDSGHGTHIAGTIAGRLYGIGVAPEAQWIACMGCKVISCSSNDLLECGQWAACPSDSDEQNRDCSKAPNAVSNGWGSAGGSRFYDEIIDSWVALDIVPFFNTGSTGSQCESISSPADYEPVIAVAATSKSDEIPYGGDGPNYLGQIKPNVAAPGEFIVSAFNTADNSYATLSGSTAAPPHVAGLVALLHSVQNGLSYKVARAAVEQGAQPVTPAGSSCGGISDSIYPNNHAGHGRVDAVASVAKLRELLRA